MSAGPEGRYISKVHRQLTKSRSIYSMKMNMGMGAPRGVPDYYYEGNADILWVEYKVLPVPISSKRKLPWSMFSAHQLNWIIRAQSNGRPVAGIIGDPDGNGIFISGYEFIKRPELDEFMILNPKEMAEIIRDLVMING